MTDRSLNRRAWSLPGVLAQYYKLHPPIAIRIPASGRSLNSDVTVPLRSGVTNPGLDPQEAAARSVRTCLCWVLSGEMQVQKKRGVRSLRALPASRQGLRGIADTSQAWRRATAEQDGTDRETT